MPEFAMKTVDRSGKILLMTPLIELGTFLTQACAEPLAPYGPVPTLRQLAWHAGDDVCGRDDGFRRRFVSRAWNVDER
jgi:hypothetical protein